jgi:PAS domain S-box-containing protein
MPLHPQDILLGSTPARHSLRSRLLKLAFLPLVVAFPVVLLVLGMVGGALYDARLAAVVRSNLATVRSYLDHQRLHTEIFISQQLKSAALSQLLADKASSGQLEKALTSQAAGMRLDFLFIADRQGKIVAANTGAAPGVSLAASFVLQQAITGVLASGFEIFEPEQLAALSLRLGLRARGSEAETPAAAAPTIQDRGLALLAAAPFPLSNDYPDAVLCGGILLNNSNVLIDHIRAITFPITPETERVNGVVALFIDNMQIAASIETKTGLPAAVGERESALAWEIVGGGKAYVRQDAMSGALYLNAFAPIIGAGGKPIGMMSAGIPSTSYRNEKWLLIGSIAALLILSMLGSAMVFKRGTRSIVKRLENMTATMKAAHTDLHGTRIALDHARDEITLLGAHFNELLDALLAGEEAQARARQEVVREAARRRALFDHERDGLVLLNEDGSIFEANPSFLAMLGYEPQELAELRIGDWDARLQQIAADDVAAWLKESDRFHETHYRRKDGASTAVEVSISCIEWDNRILYLLSVRDATEFRELQRQLMQAQRLESLGQIAAGIAHEINSPMQFLLSNVSFIEDSFASLNELIDKIHDKPSEFDQKSITDGIDVEFLNEEIPLCFKEMHEGIDRVVKIVSAMKEFSHPGSSSKTLTDINHLLDNTLIVCRNEWKYDAQVITCFDPELPRTRCFPDQLNQVLLNLIINACHAIQSKKEASPEHAGCITISTKHTGNGIEILVEDNGCGIPETIMHRIFDPFFTTKTVGKGTGQGLAIVHDLIVNKHGGHIHCDSTPGQGTTFTVLIPLLAEQPTSGFDPF